MISNQSRESWLGFPPSNVLLWATKLLTDFECVNCYDYVDLHHLMKVSSTVLALRHLSADAWFVRVDQMCNGKTILRNPMTGMAYENLPQDFPTTWEKGDFCKSELASGHSFLLYPDLNMTTTSRFCTTKVAVVFTPLYFWVSNDPDESNDCAWIALVLYGDGKLGEIVSHSYGEIDWPSLDYGWNDTPRFVDILSYGQTLYALDWHGELYSVNSEDFLTWHRVRQSNIAPPPIVAGDNKRLVESPSGELFLIAMVKPWRFRAFNKCYEDEMLEMGGRQYWEELDNLGEDLVLCVTKEHCFFTNARDFPGFQLGNCIVFTKGCFPCCSSDEDDIFSNTIGEQVGVFRFGCGDNIELLSPYSSDFPTMPWSIPTWVLQAHASKENPKHLQEEGDGDSMGLVEKQKDLKDTLQSPEHLNSDYAEKLKGLDARQESVSLQVSQSALVEKLHPHTPGSNRTVHVQGSIVITKAMILDPKFLDPGDYIEVYFTHRKVTVNGYRMDEVLAPFYHRIQSKFGDIFDGSQIQHPSHCQRQLVWVLEVVAFLQALTTPLVTFVDLGSIKTDIAELEGLGMKLSWLQKMVDELSVAQRILKELPDILTTPIAEPPESVRQEADRLRAEAQILREEAEKMESEANILCNAGFETRGELLLVREKLLHHMNSDFGTRWFQ